MSEIRVEHGDSREVIKTLADCSIDSVVCDPPYALVSTGKRFGADYAAPAKEGKTGAYQRASSGFMGKSWDTGETAFDPDFWREVLRVLKPGAHVVAFGGTRSFHRLVCAIEDAGFEIRDQLAWIYGSGFPKNHDVSKGIDKSLGAERKKVRVDAPKNPPNLVGGVNNGSGRPWVDRALAQGFHEAVSPEAVSPEAVSPEAVSWEGWGTALKPALEPICLARKPLDGTVAANVLAYGSGALNIGASRIGSGTSRQSCSGGMAGKASPVFGRFSGPSAKPITTTDGRWPAHVLHDGSAEAVSDFPNSDSTIGKPRGASPGDGWGMTQTGAEYDDGGSAARFFYSAKADSADRLGSKHPTVKPVDLMRWLCTLVTPPGGTILDPFAGSGTTGLAALGAGFDCILIEREEEYVVDIRRRLAWARGEGRLTAQEEMRQTHTAPDHGPLFGPAA